MTYFSENSFFFIIIYAEKILWCILINGAVPSRDLGVFYLLNFVSIHPYVFTCKNMKCMIVMSLLQEKLAQNCQFNPHPLYSAYGNLCFWPSKLDEILVNLVTWPLTYNSYFCQTLVYTVAFLIMVNADSFGLKSLICACGFSVLTWLEICRYCTDCTLLTIQV